MVRRMKEMYPRAINLAASGQINLDSVVSSVFPLAQADEAFTRACARSELKVIIDPGAVTANENV